MELKLLSSVTDGTSNVWDTAGNYEIIWFGDRPVGQRPVNGVASYTFADHLGAPILQTNHTIYIPSVLWRAEYEPFGNIYVMRAGSRGDQPLRFPGQELAMAWEGEEESYNIFRWYRSGWGRYTQADPIGLSGGLNLFRYAAANPLGNTDRTGLVCGVYWWSNEIGGFWGTLFGWMTNHQFVTWPTGALGFQPNGGSSDVTLLNGVLTPIPGHVSHDTPNPDYDTRHETYWSSSRQSQCPNCKDVWRCLDNFAAQFENTVNEWCVLGNNCQTAVSDALSACGLSRTPPAPPSPRFPHNGSGRRVLERLR